MFRVRLKNILWLSVKIFCYLACGIQVFLLIVEQISPTQTETNQKEIKMEEIEFPVIFKICFKNSFDLDKLKEVGYKSVWNYFKGESKFNDSIYGWAGHRKDGSVGPGVKGEKKDRYMRFEAKNVQKKSSKKIGIMPSSPKSSSAETVFIINLTQIVAKLSPKLQLKLQLGVGLSFNFT